jgi:tRNA 2-selenouridine synthase
MSENVRICDVQEFFSMQGLCFDVRSPSEYAHAHIVNAISLPLFSDSERAQVGTMYKKVGRKEAIELGVQIVGPKLWQLVESTKHHFTASHKSTQNTLNTMPLRFYCWRGGMRSGFVSWFINFIGYPCVTLRGGYKAYRREVLKLLEQVPPLVVLGGFTGCGKTELLQELKTCGDKVIDLEGLARHKGSVYGAHEDNKQPSSEHFENTLAHEFSKLGNTSPVWIEDESRLIGLCTIPQFLFSAMQSATLVIIDCSKDERIHRIMQGYGHFPVSWWKECTSKLQKRLGGARTNEIVTFIEGNRLEDAIFLLLDYYDKAYLHSMSKRTGKILHVRREDFLVSRNAILQEASSRL